jgi:hypothetical protein
VLSCFPAFVAIDAEGNDLYASAPGIWRAEREGTGSEREGTEA